MIQKLYFILIAGTFVLISLSSANAKLYKYVDENGVVSYTDNYSKASGSSKNEVEELDEILTEEIEQKADKNNKEDFQKKKPGQASIKELNLLKIELDQEYNFCTIEKNKLDQEKEKIKTNEEKIEFNKKVKELNKRIEAYTEKNKAYQKLIDEYNNSISNK